MTVLVLLVVFVFKLAWLLVAVAATAVFGRAVGGWLALRDDRALERRQRDAEIRARADQQQAWVLTGDDRGVYGSFPPAA
jgi:hypothetical protein